MAINQQHSLKVKIATRLAMSNRDLLECDGYLRTLINGFLQPSSDEYSDHNIIRRSLISAAIVAYSKPFGGNSGADISTKQIDVQDFIGPNFDLKLHKKILELRNKAVAHGDADIVPVQLIDHNIEGMLVVAELPLDLFSEISPEIMLSNVHNLLENIQSHLHQYSDELREIPGALGERFDLSIKENASNNE